MATEQLKLTTARKTTGADILATAHMETVRNALAQPPFTTPSDLHEQGTGSTSRRDRDWIKRVTTTDTTTVTDPSTNEKIVFETSNQSSDGRGMNGGWHTTHWSEIRTHTLSPDGSEQNVAVIREYPRQKVVTHPPMTKESNGPLDIFDANLARARSILERQTAPADESIATRKVD